MTGDRRPVSTLQRMLLLVDRYRSGAGVMNVPAIRLLRGSLDVPALEDALLCVESRHDALRLRIRKAGLRWVQDLPAPRRRRITVDDVRGSDDPASEVDRIVRAVVAEEIDTAEGPPYTVHLVRSADEEHTLVLNVHHLVTDAWSNGVVVRDLLRAYAGRLRGDVGGLPPVHWQYFDFLDWQEERLTGEAARDHVEFWIRTLGDAPRVALRSSPEGADRSSPPAAHTWFEIDPDLAAEVAEFAAGQRTTPFCVHLCVFNAVLRARTGDRDVTLGSIFANRGRPEVGETVGFFATMVALRTRLEDGASFATWLRATRRTVLDGLGHQEFPYLALPPRTLPRNGDRLDRVVFHMLPAPPHLAIDTVERDTGLTCTTRRMPEGSGSRFDMELMMIPRPDGGTDGVFRYAADLFGRDEVRAMADHYLAGLLHGIRRPDVTLDGVPARAPATSDTGEGS